MCMDCFLLSLFVDYNVWYKHFVCACVLLHIYWYYHGIFLCYCFSLVWRSGGVDVLRLGAWDINRHRCAQQVSAIWRTLGCYWQRRRKHADPANCWRLAGPWKQLLHTHKNNNIKMQVMLWSAIEYKIIDYWHVQASCAHMHRIYNVSTCCDIF